MTYSTALEYRTTVQNYTGIYITVQIDETRIDEIQIQIQIYSGRVVQIVLPCHTVINV